MGHLVLLIMHVAALLTAPAALFLTIPLHLIYGTTGRKGQPEAESPNPSTHVRCPDCRELVRKDASICKHCGCRLAPQP